MTQQQSQKTAAGAEGIGAALRALRGDLKYTELAEKTGINRMVLSWLESGKRQPTLNHLKKLAAAYKLTLPGLMKKLERGD